MFSIKSLFNKADYTNPRLFHQQAIPLNRIYIILLSVIYIFYGFFSRDPWKNEDVIGFGSIYSLIKKPISSWYDIYSLTWDSYGQIYYIYSGLITKFLLLFDVRVDHAIRIGTILLLFLILFLIWKISYNIATRKNFIPYVYPLGGEPSTTNYARCIADMSVMLFCSCIGSILRIHETTPFIFGIFLICLLIYTRLLRRFIFGILVLGVIVLFNHPLLSIICIFYIIYTYLKDFSYIFKNSYIFHILTVVYLVAIIFFLKHNFNYLSLELVQDRLNILATQFPTFTWPLLPFSIFSFFIWYKDKTVRLLFLQIILVIFLFLLDKQLHQAYFLYTLPSLCILSSLCFTKTSNAINKGIINFSIIGFSVLIISMWVIWGCWQLGIQTVNYLNFLNNDFTFKSIVFALGFTLLWIFIITNVKTLIERKVIWATPFIMSTGLTISWAIIVYLWLPAVNQVKTYRYVFNTINLYTKNSCVKVENLQAPQLASMSYMGNFKIGNNCQFILTYSPYKNDDVLYVPKDAVLIWQGRRILDKNEAFYLWKIQENSI